jgi:hypothetical protein
MFVVRLIEPRGPCTAGPAKDGPCGEAWPSPQLVEATSDN